MLSFHKSKNLVADKDFNAQPIYLFQQFFIHKDSWRQENEIKFCVKKNIENPHIEEFIMLNERIYTDNEIGCKSNKLTQKKIKNRMKYIDILKYVKKRKLNGYIVFTNSDIFLDETINNIRRTDFHKNKNFMALLRHDYNSARKSSKIFGPRFDSQDAWIIHTDFLPSNDNMILFDFLNGKPGCDNKLVYIAKMLNYDIYNVPKLIKINHVQKSNARDYHGKKDIVHRPHIYFEPFGFSTKQSKIKAYLQVFEMNKNLEKMNYDDNMRLYNYISTNIFNEQKFYIPAIEGPESFWSWVVYSVTNKNVKVAPKELLKYLKDMELSNLYFADDLNLGASYAELYLTSINESKVYSLYNLYDNQSQSLGPAIDFYKKNYDRFNIWREVFNIGHFVLHEHNWARALSYRKVLVITPLSEEISNEKRNPNNFFKGNKIFEETIFTFMEYKIGQMVGKNVIDIANMYLNNISQADFDIALLDCQGLGNILAYNIYKQLGKSAINVGSNLPLLFGYYTSSYKQSNPDIAKLFIDKKWKCLDKI